MTIFAQAPMRISLFGGGTDLPSYSGGFVINLAINLRNHLTLYLKDDLFSTSYNKIPGKADPILFYEILKAFGIGSMHHARFESTCDGSVKCGLGSSASAGVMLIAAINKAQNLGMTKEQIAEKSFEIESSLWSTGKQDAYASAFGGMNIFEFNKKVNIYGIRDDVARNIKKHLFLFYVGGERQPQAKSLINLDAIKDLAQTANLHLNDVEELGHDLNKSWQLKKSSNPLVTNKKIDDIYELALSSGAWGGKVCGSGGAGYMVFMTDQHDKLVENLKTKGIEEVDFDISWDGAEARIL